MRKAEPKHKMHLVNPHCFFLAIMNYCLDLFGCSLLASFFLRDHAPLYYYLIPLIPMLILTAVYIWNGYEYFGIWKAKEDGIQFYSLLRAPFFFPYASMTYIGIDYGYLQGERDLWIYLSETPIEKRYQNRINRKPFRKTSMRIHYSKEAFDCLVNSIPPEVSKKLQRAYSVVRLCGEAD